MTDPEITSILARLDTRLAAIEQKLDTVRTTNRKSHEWIGTLAQHIQRLDQFRDEVRASFEPFSDKLGCQDEVLRILRHATADVSRRIDNVESELAQQNQCMSA